MASPRFLFIGLDGMDPDLAQEWARAGELSVLADLLERGISGTTENPVGFYVGGIWPTFVTSCTPARHGQYCWLQFDPETYQEPGPPYDDGDAEPFWLTLDRAGRRVGLLDLPRTILYPEFGGLQVHDWATHDPLRPGFRTSPPELAAEIRTRHGGSRSDACNGWPRASVHDHEANLARLCDRIRDKVALARDLLGREAWDFFAVGFGDAHCVGHQYWSLHEPNHPGYDAAVRRALGDPFRTVYRALDAAVGELLQTVGRETPTCVLLSHGMGPHFDGSHLLDAALERIERRLPGGRPLTTGERVMRLRSTRHRTSRHWPRRLWRRWPHRMFRRVFQVQNNEAYAGIRINLAGRESRGRIRPEEVEPFVAWLTEELKALRNPDTGRPAFRRVLRTDTLYQGPRISMLPDLLGEWDRAGPYRALESPTVGRVTGEYTGPRSGDHRPDGLFVGTGPGWSAHRLAAPVSVMDFGPTIAGRLGVSLPQTDGRPIPELSDANLATPP